MELVAKVEVLEFLVKDRQVLAVLAVLKALAMRLAGRAVLAV